MCKYDTGWVIIGIARAGREQNTQAHTHTNTHIYFLLQIPTVSHYQLTFHPTLRCFTRGAHEQRFVLCHFCSTLTKVHLKALTWHWPATRLDCIHGKNSGPVLSTCRLHNSTLNPSDWLSPSLPPFSGCVCFLSVSPKPLNCFVFLQQHSVVECVYVWLFPPGWWVNKSYSKILYTHINKFTISYYYYQ